MGVPPDGRGLALKVLRITRGPVLFTAYLLVIATWAQTSSTPGSHPAEVTRTESTKSGSTKAESRPGNAPQASSAESAQTAPDEREFPFSVAAVQSALQQMGVYRGSRLPSLEGFVEVEPSAVPEFQHPYYEFKIDLKPLGSTQTLVNVQANVTAWYADPQGNNSGYQKFRSNGRLEADLLDRLGSFLIGNKSVPTLEVERQIGSVRKQLAESQLRSEELEKQLREAQASGNVDSKKEYVEVAKARAPVFGSPENQASILLRAEPEDEFEVLERRGGWVRVRLEGDRGGWIQTSLLKSGSPAATSGAAAQAMQSAFPGFTVIRETISRFSGDWPRLKGKQALYVWARPEASALTMGTGDKLRFAEHIFMERYRQAAHDSRNSVEGIVVIFLDQRGGVAAANLDDIHFWADGSLTSAAFVKKCSLDPPGAFESPATADRMAIP